MATQRHDRLDYGYANEQQLGKLQFQSLDWHRHGFLLWHEQSSFNHHEWTYY